MLTDGLSTETYEDMLEVGRTTYALMRRSDTAYGSAAEWDERRLDVLHRAMDELGEGTTHADVEGIVYDIACDSHEYVRAREGIVDGPLEQSLVELANSYGIAPSDEAHRAMMGELRLMWLSVMVRLRNGLTYATAVDPAYGDELVAREAERLGYNPTEQNLGLCTLEDIYPQMVRRHCGIDVEA